MLEHNIAHTEEAEKLAQTLRSQGQDEAANAVLEGVDDYKKGNQKLHNALHLLEDEEN
jgi:hypothetical protein